MKHAFFLGAAAIAAMVWTVSCGSQDEAAESAGTSAGSLSGASKTLHIYNWGDYMAEDVIKAFEEKTGCQVKVDTFDSNEAMYAKLQTGAGGYDIVVPSAYQAKMMDEQDMLEKLDASKLPNVAMHFDHSYDPLMLDVAMAYSVPYFVSFTGIGYDITRVKDFEPTWRMFERAELKGACSLLDDQREALGCALKTLGYSVNETDAQRLDEAVALLKTWKKNIAKFGVDDCKQSLASGEFAMIQTYSGDMLQVMMEKPEVRFVIPKEGSTVTFDTLAIMKNSRNKELAYQFIDFLYETDQAVKNMNEIMYIMPHRLAVKKTDGSLQQNPAFNIPPEMRSRCQPLINLGEKKVVFDKAWDQVKSGD